jgi:ABC-type amino acid transport substrate-binding protein
VVASVTILEERKKRMAFSIPYLRSGLALVVRRDLKKINSIEDLKREQLLIGAQLGTTSYFYLEKDPAIRKKGYQAYGHAVADLIKGEIGAVLGESTGTLYYKNQRKDYFQKIKIVEEILTEEYYGIVLRKTDPDLLNKIDTALKQLLEDGTVNRLHTKWELGKAAQVPTLD